MNHRGENFIFCAMDLWGKELQIHILREPQMLKYHVWDAFYYLRNLNDPAICSHTGNF